MLKINRLLQEVPHQLGPRSIHLVTRAITETPSQTRPDQVTDHNSNQSLETYFKS
jgi:hypothetical protein